MGKVPQIIGAANTVLPIRSWNVKGGFNLKDQRLCGGPVLALHGENIDWLGIKNCMLRYLSPARTTTTETRAIILDAGGMSLAALYTAIYCISQSGIDFLVNSSVTEVHQAVLLEFTT